MIAAIYLDEHRSQTIFATPSSHETWHGVRPPRKTNRHHHHTRCKEHVQRTLRHSLRPSRNLRKQEDGSVLVNTALPSVVFEQINLLSLRPCQCTWRDP